MRGDRPPQVRELMGVVQASPHARGSTFPEDSEAGPENGFPACAGIDPMLSDISDANAGLPRMRGDRPEILRRYMGARTASPHARGSTAMEPPLYVRVRGFPACAGIDLLRY